MNMVAGRLISGFLILATAALGDDLETAIRRMPDEQKIAQLILVGRRTPSGEIAIPALSRWKRSTPPKTEARNRQRDTPENRNDARDGHELGDRKAAFMILTMLRNDCSAAPSA